MRQPRFGSVVSACNACVGVPYLAPISTPLFVREATMRSTLSLTCVLIATACAGGSAPPAGLSAEDVAAIKRVQEKYNQTLLAGDWAGVAAVHTPDAVRMPPNAPDVRGRAAIEAAMATSGKPVAITTTITEIDGRGDVGYELVNFSITLPAQGAAKPVTTTGLGLVIMRRQPGGSLLGSRVIWNR